MAEGLEKFWTHRGEGGLLDPFESLVRRKRWLSTLLDRLFFLGAEWETCEAGVDRCQGRPSKKSERRNFIVSILQELAQAPS